MIDFEFSTIQSVPQKSYDDLRGMSSLRFDYDSPNLTLAGRRFQRNFTSEKGRHKAPYLSVLRRQKESKVLLFQKISEIYNLHLSEVLSDKIKGVLGPPESALLWVLMTTVAGQKLRFLTNYFQND